MKSRSMWVLLHRYLGLTTALFLAVVGLTGSLMAFHNELDALCNPDWRITPHTGMPLKPSVLLEIVEQFDSRVRADDVWLNGTSANIGVSPRTDPTNGKPYTVPYDKLMLNAYTGKVLGGRRWGDLSQGLTNLVPFIYTLHYSLALGELGYWLLGLTALIWTLDCFVGVYLTLPAGRANRSWTHAISTKTFWQRWRPAWLIKWSASKTRINFDLHRAGGLWLWLALLVFAWSSVYMNLSDVYTTVMRSVSQYHQPWTDFPDLPKPVQQPQINWQQAQDLAQAELLRLEDQQGIRTVSPCGFWINRVKGFYVYTVKSTADIQDHCGQTRVVIDANSGTVKQVLLPTGQYSGNTVTSWLLALHTANVWGLPYKIFVCVLGLVIVMLSVTGVLIWLKKRQRHRRNS